MAENEKINLLFIPYTFTNGGGAEKILQMLVNFLPLNKFNITIQEIENFGKELKVNDGIKQNVSFFGQSILDKIFYQCNYTLLLNHPSLLKTLFFLNNYDVVVTYNYQLPSFMLPAFKEQKRIAWFHTDIYDLNENNMIWEKKKQKKVWNNIDKIVTISNYSYKSLNDVFPEFIEKGTIIHNGMDFSAIQELSNEECDFDFSGSPVITCVGRIDERKNFQYAIKILYELKNQNIDCRLLIVGDGNLRNDIVELAKSLNVYDRVFFTGFQKNPYKYIKHSKLLCVTSFAEGWPTVVMEAMSLGIPFITTPVAGASEELSDNGNCGIVVGYDEKEYASAIIRLLKDEKLYAKMSMACKTQVMQYSAEKYAQNFMNLLDELNVNEAVHNKKNESKFKLKIKTLLSYILYSCIFVINIEEIINRIAIITKRIKERRVIKIVKNTIYLFGIIILFPIISIIKLICLPFYFKRLLKNK